MKLQAKTVVFVIISTIVSFLGILGLLFLLGEVFAQGYKHEDFDRIQQEVQRELEATGSVDRASAARVLERFAERYEGIDMELFNENGVAYYSASGRERVSIEELAGQFIGQPYNLFAGKDVSLLFEQKAGGKRYFLLFHVAGSALSDVQVYVYITGNSSAALFLFLPLTLMALLPALLTISFLVTVNRRIRKLSTAMQIANMRILPPAPTDRSKDEIGQLNRLFYDMSVRINQQYTEIKQVEQTRKSLVSHLSHDLRTPLAAIIGYAESLQQGAGRYSREQAVLYAGIILQRAEYIQMLLNKLFEISLIDDGFKGNPVRADLCELTRRIVAEYVLILEEETIEAAISIPETPVWVKVDEYHIGQGIRNLLDNAIMYGGAGKYIGVKVEEEANTVRLTIADKGKGISPVDQKHIFERFVRMDESRKIGGIGIGLSITKEVVNWHGGQLTVESEPNRWTAFTIELPKWQEGQEP